MMVTEQELDKMNNGEFFGYAHGYAGHDCRTWQEIVRIHQDEAKDYLKGFNAGVEDRELDAKAESA